MQNQPLTTSTKEQRSILFVLGTLIALGPFSIDMYLPSFEAIARDFGIEKSEIGLSLTSYFIGISIGQLAYGPLMDKFGRKKPLLIGIIIYIIASIACAFSPNLYFLVIARFFLALGASAGMVAAKAVVRDVFKPEEVARAISFLMLIMGGAPIIAPTVGSAVMHYFNWNIIFVVLAIIAVLMLISVYSFLPESIHPDKSVNLRLRSVLQKYVQIFSHPVFLTFSLAGGFSVGALFAYIASAPVLFTDILQVSQKHFGWLFGINAAGLILGSQLNRVFLKKYTTLQVSRFISVLLLIFGCFLIINAYLFHSFYGTIIGQFFILFFLGFQNPNTTALSMMPFTKKAGRASALVGSLKMGVGALISFIISKFTGITLVNLALITTVCLAISAFFIFKFKKEL